MALVHFRKSVVIKGILALCAVWFILSFVMTSKNTPDVDSSSTADEAALGRLRLKKMGSAPSGAGNFEFPNVVPGPVQKVFDKLNIFNANIPAPRIGPAFDPKAPGEKGEGVDIKEEDLSPEERVKFKEGWQNNAFNQYASDMISLHRSLPEIRPDTCLSLEYGRRLPDTSVIICFHNEAWSVLLRTVHSVIDRSPPHMLKEILLVDDFSDKEHLKKPLEEYVSKLSATVRVVRLPKREGLIRARLTGAREAAGQVLTFLDSHCECAEGWLEPLLYEIQQDESNVVTPVIDVIDDNTLRYMYSRDNHVSVGGFDWNLQFNWHAMPAREKKRRKASTDPVWSPTMAGGLFSISRAYFERIGSYDPGMDIWGGENLEISFRVWMCGGTLATVPCSHVGHIFRKRSPYTWRGGVNVLKKNSIRVAEVWMDDYKKYYYERFNYQLGDYGDVSQRRALRDRLQCKSFDWYIKNIFPELFVPSQAVASGEIRNNVEKQCVDSPADHKSYNKAVKMWPCHNQGGNQYWMLSKGGEIRRDEGCMDWTGSGDITMYACHSQKGNQEWVYTSEDHVKHQLTGKCMQLSGDGRKLEMAYCNKDNERQKWTWKRKSSVG